MEARHLPKAIQWHEGMLLTPQHFQQLSLRHEELVHYNLTAAIPFYWGIKKSEFDKALLTEGIFRISELEAIMPDGTIVWHYSDDSGENDLRVDLNPQRDRIRSEPLMIYLAVPAKRIYASKGFIERYRTENESVSDENGGEAETDVPRLIPHVKLLTAEEPPQKYSSFPIAQAAYKNEQMVLTEFSPPRLFIPLESDIGKICSTIVKLLREKSRFLSEQVSNPASVVRGSVLFETRFLIHSMIAELPRLEALLNTGLSHPYLLHLCLCSLSGNVSSLSPGQIPPVFSSYDHNNIYPLFKETSDFILKMLECIHQEYMPVFFESEDDKFNLKIERSWFAESDRLIIGVKRKTGMTDGDIETWIKACVIGSKTKMEKIIANRILGAKRDKAQNIQGIMPTGGITMFSVSTEEYVQPDQILQIFNPAEKERKKSPAEIILYVKNT